MLPEKLNFEFILGLEFQKIKLIFSLSLTACQFCCEFFSFVYVHLRKYIFEFTQLRNSSAKTGYFYEIFWGFKNVNFGITGGSIFIYYKGKHIKRMLSISKNGYVKASLSKIEVIYEVFMNFGPQQKIYF